MNFDLDLSFAGGYLRVLRASDVHAGYVAGLNDPEVNRYLDGVRRTVQTIRSVTEFVQSNLDSANCVLWGIWEAENREHCGTIRLHGLDMYHRTAEIGICLFDKTAWGKRIGSKAIEAVTSWALNEFNLRWIEAGAYAQNVSSQRAFLRAGYDWIIDIENKYLLDGNPATVKIYAMRK